MSNRQQQTQYGYLSHRPTSPKLTPNNQSSPTNHHNLSSNLGQSSKTQV